MPIPLIYFHSLLVFFLSPKFKNFHVVELRQYFTRFVISEAREIKNLLISFEGCMTTIAL